MMVVLQVGIRMKYKKNTTLSGTIPKSNTKIVERDKIDTPNTQTRDCTLWYITYSIMKHEKYKQMCYSREMYTYAAI